MQPNKVTITERDPNKPQPQSYMNTFNKIFNNPYLLWTLGTILMVICLVIACGIKIAAGLLAAWIAVSIVIYFFGKGLGIGE